MIAAHPSYQADLELSAANGLFMKCNSWCIYDYNAMLAGNTISYNWKDNKHWKRVNGWYCFNGDRVHDFHAQLGKVKTMCPIAGRRNELLAESN